MLKARCVMAVAIWLAAPVFSLADDLISRPESIVFDSVRDRYLIINCGDGTIVQISESGDRSYFYVGPDRCLAGSHIVGDTLYVSVNSPGRLLSFDLTADTLVREMPIPVLQSLDGLTSDGSTFLYATDTGGRIFKIRIDNKSFWAFANAGLNPGLQTCVYDGANNRLLAVEFAPAAPVKAVDLATGMVSTVVSTTFGYFDGITMDHEGYTYVGTSYEERIYRYDPTFTDPPFLFAEGFGWPAGIHYNPHNLELAIPCFYQDSVAFIPDIYKRDSDEDGLIDSEDNCPNHYNPGQEDSEFDGTGDSCDNCPDIYNPAQSDVDSDGIGDSCEICRTWYVAADGSGDAPTLREAIDLMTHGDTLVVGDGIYAGPNNRDLDFGGRQGIVIRSMNGPQSTIIDCEGSVEEPRRAFTFENDADSTFVIDGFTICGGNGPSEGATPTAGAMLFDNSSPTVKNCIIIGNSATVGGALYVTGASPRLINCTLVDNSASYGAAVFLYSDASITLENCVVSFNHDGLVFYCLGSSPAALSCCDVYGNDGGDWVECLTGQEGIDGNFSADPLFCNLSIGDAGLASESSPCLPANNDCGVLIGALGEGCTCNCGTVWGDVNADDNLNPIDVVFMTNYVYLSHDMRVQPPACPNEAGDVNCDGNVNPIDMVHFVNYVYLSVTPLPCASPCGP